MCVRHQLKTDQRIVALEECLRLGEVVEIVAVILDVAVCRDQKSAGSRGRVLNDLADPPLHKAADAVDQGARREVLARSRFLLGGVPLEKPFVEIAKSLLPAGEPVQPIDRVGERLYIRWLA